MLARVAVTIECQIMHIATQNEALEPLNKSEVKVGSNVGEEVHERLYQLLQRFRRCFATSLKELGCAKDVEMTIELDDSKAVIYKPYRMAFSEREKVVT